jgi:hypothetical protein
VLIQPTGLLDMNNSDINQVESNEETPRPQGQERARVGAVEAPLEKVDEVLRANAARANRNRRLWGP